MQTVPTRKNPLARCESNAILNVKFFVNDETGLGILQFQQLAVMLREG